MITYTGFRWISVGTLAPAPVGAPESWQAQPASALDLAANQALTAPIPKIARCGLSAGCRPWRVANTYPEHRVVERSTTLAVQGLATPTSQRSHLLRERGWGGAGQGPAINLQTVPVAVQRY